MTLQYYLKAIQPDYGECDGPTDRTLASLSSGTLKQKSCGKRLHPPYYLLYCYYHGGERLCSHPCMNADDEAIQTIKIAELIKCQSKNVNLDSFGGPGDGTEQGRISLKDDYTNTKLRSKVRLCQECYDRQKRIDEELTELCMNEHEKLSLERQIYSEQENERRNKPIKSCTSELGRYITSLPDRSYMLEKELGFNVLDEYWRDWSMEHSRNLDAILHAIFSNQDPDVLEKSGASFVSDYIKQIREDIKTNFIKDSDRIFPNEQELTAYMIQNVKDEFQIQYCKIFDLGLTKNGSTKFTIIIHYSRPKGYWIDFDVPSIQRTGTFVLGCISSTIWTEYEV